MGVRFSLDFYGDAQLDRTLLRFADNIGDARPIWDKLADQFALVEARQFASEGAYGSGGWAPLAPSTVAYKARHYPGKGILERTGALRRSLTERPFGVEQLNPQSMAVGSNIAYGAFHQAGTPRMPRRRPVELPESERRTWVRMLQRFIVTGEA